MIAKLLNKGDKYTGAIVLGLHDALVEFIGIIVGLSFALENSRLVMTAAIVAGVSASLSMGASNYLAEKANENPDAIKAGLSSCLSYMATVALLVVPFAVLPTARMTDALLLMFLAAFMIILGSSYYVSRVKKSRTFIGTFSEMLIICSAVSLVAFGIGKLAKMFLGV